MLTSKALRRSAAALAVAAIAVASSFLGAALAGGPQTFSDVTPSHPFYGEIEWLTGSGITTGYPDGTFRPGAPVTRQAMAAYLQRVFAGINVESTSSTTAGPADTWELTVVCPAFTRPIAGGGYTDKINVFLTDSVPSAAGTGWYLRFESENDLPLSDLTATGYVTCATSP